MGRKRRSNNSPQESSPNTQTGDGASATIQSTERVDRRNDLRLNKEFAARFEAAERRKLLQSAPAGLLQENDADAESDSSTSEEEDDLGELLTKGIDRRVRETLDAIRSKDPRIYDKNTRFFTEDETLVSNTFDKDDRESEQSDDHESDVDSTDEPVAGWDAIAKAAKAAAQKLTIKDYVRESLLNHGTLSDGDDDDEDDTTRPDYDHERDEVTQAAFKIPSRKPHNGDAVGSIKQKSASVDKESEDELSESDGGFFTRKEKSAAEIEEEEKEFEKFLVKTARKRDEKVGQDILLHSYLENETPDEKERFLRDFVLNNGWLNRNAGSAPTIDDYSVEIDLPAKAENDSDNEDGDDGYENFDEKADAFEAAYNFRFEEPGSNKVASHSREVVGSLRRPDERRKKARRARLERKLLEKATKAEELKQLKNAKKREIEARLLAIREAAGDDNVDFNGLDLDGDFDSDKFDRQMQERFGDDYYSRNDDNMLDMDSDGGATVTEAELSRKNRSKQTNETNDGEKDNVNSLMDEYYKLDYEDIIGGTPVRFKYKQVEPESFNLSTDEILSLDDKELNRMVSVKFLAPYRSRRDVQKQAWKVRNLKHKRNFKNENVSVRQSEANPETKTAGRKARPESEFVSPKEADSNRHQRKRRKKKEATSSQ